MPGSGDRHRAVLERLAQRLERVARELGAARRGRGRRGARASPRPGRGGVPPPTSPTVEIVWCGARNGRRPALAAANRAPADARDPRHLDRLALAERRQDRRQPPRRQRLAGARRPDDQQAVAAGGGDLERPPQRRLAAQVGEVRADRRATVGVDLGLGAGGSSGSSSEPTARAGRAGRSGPPSARCARRAAIAARLGRVRGGDHERAPARLRRASSAIASAPATGRTAPSRPSSPARATALERASAGSWPEATSSAAAIARSKAGPGLAQVGRREVGVIRCCGNSKPELTIAARTRSRDSRTAASGRPTIENAGSPWCDVDLDASRRAPRPRGARRCRALASTRPTLGRAAARLARWQCRIVTTSARTRRASRAPSRSSGRCDDRTRARALGRIGRGARGGRRLRADGLAHRRAQRAPDAGPRRARPDRAATARPRLRRGQGRRARRRRSDRRRRPLAVGPRKQAKLRRLAGAWLSENAASDVPRATATCASTSSACASTPPGAWSSLARATSARPFECIEHLCGRLRRSRTDRRARRQVRRAGGTRPAAREPPTSSSWL